MNDHQPLFEAICDELTRELENVQPGKMMSAPGITYKSKVFAFYYQDEMVFRLGKGFNIEAHGITHYKFLNPFKNKPPMTAWFCVSAEHSDKWKELALRAYQAMKSEIK